MMKKLLLSILIFGLATVLLISMGFYYLYKDDPHYLVNFIEENPEKVSVYIQSNDDIIYSINEEKKLPLASLFKLVIGLELIIQHENKEIDLYQRVPIGDIEKYNYIERTNPNYLEWKRDMVGENKYVTVFEIARGMMTYSANPNTDYLIDALGIENINATAKRITKKNHSTINPIGASVVIPYYLKDVKDVKETLVIETIKNYTEDQYNRIVNDVNKYLQYDNYDKEELQNYFPTIKEQEVWSNNSPKSTAKDYGDILNNFDNILSNTDSKELIKKLLSFKKTDSYFFYGKSGKTVNIINRAVRVEQEFNDMTIVFLAHNLTEYERIKADNNLDSFVQNIVDGIYTFKKNS